METSCVERTAMELRPPYFSCDRLGPTAFPEYISSGQLRGRGLRRGQPCAGGGIAGAALVFGFRS